MHNKTINKNIWGKIFDIEYNKIPLNGFTNNTDVWKKSENKIPFSSDEMNEWLNNIYSKLDWILTPEMTVLEIGCGNGLISQYLFSRCKNYTGIDPSLNAINKLKLLYQNEVKMNFYEGDGLNIPLQGKKYDLIIINSVIQYYPDIKYTIESIRLSLENLRDNGVLFIGDVRSLTHSWFCEKELNSSLRLNFKDKINAFNNNEKELLFHTAFFKILPNYFSCISNVFIDLKRGDLVNELSKYRYDVFIFKGQFDKLNSLENYIPEKSLFINSRIVSDSIFSKDFCVNEVVRGKNLLSEKFDGSKFIDFANEYGIYYIKINNFETLGLENIFNISNKISYDMSTFIDDIFNEK